VTGPTETVPRRPGRGWNPFGKSRPCPILTRAILDRLRGARSDGRSLAGRRHRLLLLGVLAGFALAFAACNADTEPATDVTSNSATLRASVDFDRGQDVAFWFEYRRVGSTRWIRDDIHDPGPLGGSARGAMIQEPVSGLAEGETYEYRFCGYLTAPGAAGSSTDPICFDADRSSDPPHDYDRVKTDQGPLPRGFTDTEVFSGLTIPTAVRFSPDGRVFVAEKSGLIKVFSSLSDTTPEVFADLRRQVYDYWDRGLLGMALDPRFPTEDSIYVLYTHDAPIGGTAPTYDDACPHPTGTCVASARLSRLGPGGNEEVLIEDWCQQFPSHSIGSLAFGPDGALYVSAGDAASWSFVDYGQGGSSANPCGDPPGGVGAPLSPPSAEGGALRSQDLRTSADPTTLDGTILRVDPATGAAMPGNPLAASNDPNARRIVGYGLRNPFRMTFRPGTNEVWVGDVGWNDWEEIDRLVAPADASVDNFGWPCYEGHERQPGYNAANLTLCQSLYGQANAVVPPYFTYKHSAKVFENDACPIGGSSLAGLAFQFYTGGPYPPEYDGALFFADYTRDCIWVMRRSGGVLPSPSNVDRFVRGAPNPVDLQIGPGGDLFYVDLGGYVRRIRFTEAANQAPRAVATANPTSGNAPLTVNFDGTGSVDPDADALSYAWDLDGDGAHDDSSASRPTWTYGSPGNYVASLRVTDPLGASNTASVTIGVGRPTVTISTPTSGTAWAVGTTISFSGSATDNKGQPIPPAGLSWSLVLHHGQCPSCHDHPLQTFSGVSSGSFVAPDHDYPSSLELSLSATDSSGLKATKSVLLLPRTTTLTLRSEPSALTLGLNGATAATPFTRTVIVGSKNTLSAPSPQNLSGQWTWASWSDGGARTHDVTAPPIAGTYTATYRK
jgi:glucose/arabinose dehydrogenase